MTATPQPSPEIRTVENADEKTKICRDILMRLPDWFGNPSALNDYTQEVRGLPFYAAFVGGGAIGFIALTLHNAHTAEICVMGITAEYHRGGIGRGLVDKALELCHASGRTFLIVKTLDDSDPYEPYARTRTFYRAMGFLPLQVLKDYWDADNPCLVMARNA